MNEPAVIPERRSAEAEGRDRGQVLVAVLLLAIPLSVLLVAVSRAGPSARARMTRQTAADAAALAGAAWSARTCNLLVQLHQTEAQLAAGAALLRAVKPTRLRAEAVLADLEAAGMVPADAIAAERQLLRDWEAGLADLLPLAEPGNAAGLWAAAETVESLRRALLQGIPWVAVQDAETFGRENGAESVAVWPTLPALPVVEAPATVLRTPAEGWTSRGVPRLTAPLKGPLLSDAKSIYRQEVALALAAALGSDFPARPVVWRGDAPLAIDLVAVATGGGGEDPVGAAFAQARPVNPDRGDLLTPGWGVRLVPAARAGVAWNDLSLANRRPSPPASLRVSPATVDGLTCH